MKKITNKMLSLFLAVSVLVGFTPVMAHADEDMSTLHVMVKHDSGHCSACSGPEMQQTFATGTTHTFFVTVTDSNWQEVKNPKVQWSIDNSYDFDVVLKANGSKCKVTFNESTYLEAISSYIYMDLRASVEGVGSSTLGVRVQDGYVYKPDLAYCDIILSDTVYAYTGKAIKPSVKVMDGTKVLKKGTDYKVSYEDNVNPGRGVVRISAPKNSKYGGSGSALFDIQKVVNYNDIKKKAQTCSVKFPKPGDGKYENYSLTSAANAKGKDSKKYFTVSKAGKLTIKKNTPKGTYELQIECEKLGDDGGFSKNSKWVTVVVK